ncbi:DUF1643 domain-containing protein [Staphylococcus saprophyticus]|uniref:DUF1643 domain-containing protein n=1 Tax=Staphylococcus saprophyticus TaxID=29385 RepID=UPI000D1E9031|nr:DUF1643 domain-containing protein [Staphylococcus saprophyticus]MDW3947366.1 DUF1643 domain-containing protein [Staphylococcus saprophyticus]MDW3992554.1 DUF1643 domain-containing protein [Staphylococcus saprophyticus]MDW4029998.1 DUF1643 domain-containing protein [Staphylococcus saprophyticus]MDW4085064.1 DUF1643 domain-containing protein [Staphylococcus saprophyticus]MDW4126524.1 DUF1643 domain-containing protein [Staphylococcus saprophyticus]
METIKSTLETEAIFSDDQQHRYILKKTWDSEKQTITIITMYPHYDGILNIDLTTQLIINKVSEMKTFGSINFVNLYSNITTPINLKHLENAYDKHTDIQIMKAVKESDEVILAWGAYAKKPVVEARVNEVLEMLKPHKKKVKQLVNPATNEIMHPLNPKARSKWTYK